MAVDAHTQTNPAAPIATPASSRLRQRMIDDMSMRGFGEKTQKDYIRFVRSFAAFLDRLP